MASKSINVLQSQFVISGKLQLLLDEEMIRPFLLSSLPPSRCTVRSYRPHLEVRAPFEEIIGRTALIDSVLTEVSGVFLSRTVNVRRSVHSPWYHLLITLSLAVGNDTRH